MPASKITGSSVEDGSEFFYVILHFEIRNAIGAIVAVLDEYFIKNKGGVIFKLYTTNEGNWFNFPGVNSGDNYSFLRQLKVALDNQNLE